MPNTVAIIHNHPIHYKHLLFQELKRQGLDFEVLFAATRSSMRYEDDGLSQDLYRYRTGYNGPYESAPFGVRVHFTWRALQNIRPSTVVIGGYHTPEAWTAWIWARLHRRPIVLWYESNEFDYKRVWLKEFPKKLFLRHCDRAQVYGTSHKAYLVKLGMPDYRVILKLSVANIHAFSASPNRAYSAPTCKHLVYVGRLAPEKNVGIVLRSLALASQKSEEQALRFTIIGSGPLEQQLKQESIDLGISHLVTFIGYCQQKDLPKVLGTADFFILPSTREPWGLAALEAMLCRVPVLISTQCGCAADMITPETGWTFSPWNEDELAALLAQLPSLSAERLAIMGNACHRVATTHNAANCAARVIASLRELESGSNNFLLSGKGCDAS